MAKKESLPPEKNALRRWQALSAALWVALCVVVAYAVYHHEIETAFENPYPLIDPARSFIPQEHFIVNIQPLRERLDEIVNKTEAEGGLAVSLYFEYLNTGANIQINPNAQVWPASLPKVPMAMAVMKKVESGAWDLDSELVLHEQDKDTNFGELWSRPTGSRFTIEELLYAMLVNSDNTPYQMFLRNLDFADFKEVIDDLGLGDAFTKEGYVSAKEYSRFFRALYTSSFLTRKSSEQILSWLAESSFKEFLSAGIPQEITFSHKFGLDLDDYAYLDSGIVYLPNRPYLITVAITGKGKEGEQTRVEEFMKAVSVEIHQYVSNQ